MELKEVTTLPARSLVEPLLVEFLNSDASMAEVDYDHEEYSAKNLYNRFFMFINRRGVEGVKVVSRGKKLYLMKE